MVGHRDIRSILLIGPVALAACSGSAAPSKRATPTVAVIVETTSAPRLTLSQLPLKSGTPLTVQALIVGLFRCTLTMTAITGTDERKVISHGSDEDGPKPGAPTANYMDVTKVPAASRRVTASAECTYVSRGKTRHVNLTASIPIRGRGRV